MSQEAFARRGFTMVEMLIVLGIFAAVMGTILPFVGSFQQTTLLDTQIEDMVYTLRKAQSRALHGRQDSDWGVRFLADSYVLFAGSGYVSRETAFDEPRTFDLVYNVTGSGEVVFQRQSGKPVHGASVTLFEVTSGTGTIVILSSGQVSHSLELLTQQ